MRGERSDVPRAPEHAVEQVGVDVGPRPPVGEGDGGGSEPMPAGVAAAPHARARSHAWRGQRAAACPTDRSTGRAGRARTRAPQAAHHPRRSASRAAGGRASSRSAVSRSGMASAGTRWSTPSRWCVLVRRRCTTRRSPSAEESSCGTTAMSRARGSAAAVGEGFDLADVRGPRQRPLHQQQLIERTGGADRVHPLRLRPRRAAERRIPRGRVGFGCVDGAHQMHATDRRPSAGWGGPIDGGIGSIPAGQPAHNRTRVGEAGRSPALTRSRRPPTLVPVASRNASSGASAPSAVEVCGSGARSARQGP